MMNPPPQEDLLLPLQGLHAAVVMSVREADASALKATPQGLDPQVSQKGLDPSITAAVAVTKLRTPQRGHLVVDDIPSTVTAASPPQTRARAVYASVPILRLENLP